MRCDLNILTGGKRAPGKSYATTYLLSNPAPGENLESGNLVMETGCKTVVVNFSKYSEFQLLRLIEQVVPLAMG